MTESQPFLIITGMHRSGTSLTAQLLQRAGLALGANLNPPAPDNPRGSFEDMDVVSFHQELLRARGQTIFADQSFIFAPTDQEIGRAHALVARLYEQNLRGWKDPRASLFLDLWANVLPNARYVFVYRSPFDVLLSLMRRQNRDLNGLLEAFDAWTTYNQNILNFYARHANAAVLCEIDALAHSPKSFFNCSLTNLVSNSIPTRKPFPKSITQLNCITHRWMKPFCKLSADCARNAARVDRSRTTR